MINGIQFISQETASCTHIDSIRDACAAGIRWIQLRVKEQPEARILRMAQEAKMVCDDFGAKLIINDHPHIAAQVNAYGVHLGKEDMPVAAARPVVGTGMIIGATANTFEEIKQHWADGADYVGLGPFRFTATKKKLSPVLGLSGYRDILHQCLTRSISIPIIAIGGIELADVPEILQTGVHGIAVSTLIACAQNKKEIADQLVQTFKTHQNQHVNYSQQSI